MFYISKEVIKIVPALRFLKNRNVRRRIILKYSIAAVLLVTMFTAGFVRVYVNTYNIMHEDKMVVFDLDRSEEGTRLTVLGHVFESS